MEQKKNPAAISLGSLGGKARAKALTAKQRREIAIKGSKAAAKKRKEKAEQKRAT